MWIHFQQKDGQLQKHKCNGKLRTKCERPNWKKKLLKKPNSFQFATLNNNLSDVFKIFVECLFFNSFFFHNNSLNYNYYRTPSLESMFLHNNASPPPPPPPVHHWRRSSRIAITTEQQKQTKQHFQLSKQNCALKKQRI